MLSILIGSLLENEQHGEPVILHDEGHFQEKAWKMMIGHVIDNLKRRWTSMLIAKVHLFAASVFCTSPGALDPTSASQFLEMKAEAFMKSNKCKN